MIRGRDAYRAVTEQYPGRESTPLTVETLSIQGADDQFVARASWPAWTVVHLPGSDDQFTVAGPVRYPERHVRTAGDEIYDGPRAPQDKSSHGHVHLLDHPFGVRWPDQGRAFL